ncbi:MAG: YigZ family protein [Cyclobacteriaceae bacterium]
MTKFSYLTVTHATEGLYKEKGSRFLSFCFPVANQEDIKVNLEKLRKKYYDARHHCYAWMLGSELTEYRANDDGEPNHSAGDPILGQIKSKGLTNVLIVVVRYFGGTKLGVGGLINAYRTAAEDALSKVEVIKKDLTEPVTIHYDYDQTADILRLVKEFDLPILSQDFGEQCTLCTEVKSAVRLRFSERVQLLKDTGINFSVNI